MSIPEKLKEDAIRAGSLEGKLLAMQLSPAAREAFSVTNDIDINDELKRLLLEEIIKAFAIELIKQTGGVAGDPVCSVIREETH